MDLYLLRHAIAVPRESFGPDDRLRPLTSKGAEKMLRIAKGMQALDLSFDWILSSPYFRARQTAEIVSEVFKAKKKIKPVDSLSADRSPQSLVHDLNENFHDSKSLLLVGHEPYLSEFMSVLLCGRPDMDIEFKKGGLCKLRVEKLAYRHCATLEWLLSPGQLAALAKTK